MKPFNDLRVRKAVSHVINTEAILKYVLKGRGSIGRGHESPFIPGAHQGLKPHPYDPALAKKLLAEAGYPKGFGTTLYTPKGRYFMDEEVTRAIQTQLKDAGIVVRVEIPSWATYIRLLEEGTEIPMFIHGKGSPASDLNFTLIHGIKTGGKMNYSRYANPKVDWLIEQQEGIVDQLVVQRHRLLLPHLITHRRLNRRIRAPLHQGRRPFSLGSPYELFATKSCQ